jgi:hypothetical protein
MFKPSIPDLQRLKQYSPLVNKVGSAFGKGLNVAEDLSGIGTTVNLAGDVARGLKRQFMGQPQATPTVPLQTPNQLLGALGNLGKVGMMGAGLYASASPATAAPATTMFNADNIRLQQWLVKAAARKFGINL